MKLQRCETVKMEDVTYIKWDSNEQGLARMTIMVMRGALYCRYLLTDFSLCVYVLFQLQQKTKSDASLFNWASTTLLGQTLEYYLHVTWHLPPQDHTMYTVEMVRWFTPCLTPLLNVHVVSMVLGARAAAGPSEIHHSARKCR
jgi:hypothetical protein